MSSLSTELQDALQDPGFVESLTDEELGFFIEEHPELFDLVLDEEMDPNAAVDYIGEKKGFKVKAPKRGVMPKGFRAGNQGNDPFKTQPLHGTSSAGKGGGTRKNPRSKTGECKSCICKGYVCVCKCNGKPRKIDMRAYKERKKDYMFHWRRNHGPKHPR